MEDLLHYLFDGLNPSSKYSIKMFNNFLFVAEQETLNKKHNFVFFSFLYQCFRIRLKTMVLYYTLDLILWIDLFDNCMTKWRARARTTVCKYHDWFSDDLLENHSAYNFFDKYHNWASYHSSYESSWYVSCNDACLLQILFHKEHKWSPGHHDYLWYSHSHFQRLLVLNCWSPTLKSKDPNII